MEENLSSSSSSPSSSDDDTRMKKKRHVSGVVKQRPEADLRNENLEAGALLLSFESAIAPAQDVQTAWRTIEKKGLRVTRFGCLIAHDLHTPEQARHKTSAVNIAMRFFTGRSLDPTKAGSRNHLGWPEHEEYSHLCHNFSCCNPSHIVVESFWRNRKRNFCGLNGNCDCGMQPPCLKPYNNRDATARYMDDQSNLLLYSEHNLAEKLRQHVPLAKAVRILPKNYYYAEDIKRLNRIKRLRRGNVHKKQAKRKQERKKEEK